MAHEQTKVKTSSLGTGSITTTHIPDGAITSAKLGSGTISNAKSGLTASEPTFSSLTPTTTDPNSNTTITITGTNFVAVPQVWWLNTGTGARTRSGVVSFTSSTEITAQFPSGLAAGTYQAIIENATGLGVKGSTNITNSIAPNWITSAGSLGSIQEGESVSTSVLAVDDDSTAVSSYTLTSGALPSGVSLNASTGAITGTMPLVNADTTYNFTITATDDESQQTARDFSLTATDFSITNSCLFNDNDSAYMHKTPGSAGNQRKFTFSTWFKLGPSAEWITLFATGADASNRFVLMRHNESSNNSQIKIDAKTSDSQTIELRTNASFRDTNAWYHLVLAVDTEQSTSTDRVKLYINGTQITSFNQTTYPSQNHDTEVNKAAEHRIGRYNAGDYYWDGYLAETVFIDGTQYAASDFGEFDSDTPSIWKPKSVAGLTFGSNGFYLDYKDSSNLGNDANGGTDLTESGLTATDQSTDTPVNNFATINPLNTHASATLSEGNTQTSTGSNGWFGGVGTIGITYGFPVYWEAKCVTNTRLYFGLSRVTGTGGAGNPLSDAAEGDGNWDYMWRCTSADQVYYQGSDQSVTVAAVSAGDIIGCSVSSTGIVKFYKSGSLVHTFSTALSTDTSNVYFPVFSVNGFSTTETMQANFGNPPFSISSSNADANGYGSFEYAVPSSHYAMNTKNLAEYG